MRRLNMFEEAKNQIETLDKGTEFIIKDLFRGVDWNKTDIGDRRSLGSNILNEVKNGSLNGVLEVLEKNTANQQRYRKL